MPSLSFVPKHSEIHVLVPMPEKTITEDDVRTFLTDHDIQVEFIGHTSDNAFIIKTSNTPNAVVVVPGMLLACMPATKDFMAMHPQLIEIFFKQAV